jgi:hypothetical protein
MLEGNKLNLEKNQKICFFNDFNSGGKQRSKVEVQLNSQHHDAGGDTRKIVQAMANNEKNQKHEKK